MVDGCGRLISWFMLASLVKASADKPTTEKQGGVTCYTCVNVSDNLMCNQYAIDSPCPEGEDFCHTLHIMDSSGASVIVNKKCADTTECWPLGVGCVLVDTQTLPGDGNLFWAPGQYDLNRRKHHIWEALDLKETHSPTICVSCCDEMYCNVTVPTNQSNAIYSNRRTQSRTKVRPTHSMDLSSSCSTQTIASQCILFVILKSLL